MNASLSPSITIRMERKLASQRVSMWITPDVAEPAEQLRERCKAWGELHLDALKGHRPDLLGLQSRRAEVWWAVLAIGELAGSRPARPTTMFSPQPSIT